MSALKSAAIVFLSSAQLASAAVPGTAERDRAELQAFARDPLGFMTSLPPKTRSDGSRVPDSESQFPDEVTRSGEFVGIKSSMQNQLRLRSAQKTRSPAPDNDRAQDLVDQMSMWTLEDMEREKLLSAALPKSPWSGSYWPLYQGEIAYRYADPNFPHAIDWKTNQTYILDHLGASSVDELSPAEKYDRIVGDSNYGLTRASLAAGQSYYEQYGLVESWMGICHGWSPAAFMAPRPSRSVTVRAADGVEQLVFRPDDVKALTSLLWANGDYESRFIGSRCDTAHPPLDSNGRILDPTCLGENPASWHLSVVNQIGGSQRSFVMDASSDYQIWNQPVYSYHYTYFNPETLQPVATLAEATVSKSGFSHDKFASYRSSDAQFFVGISMDLTYVSERNPSPTDADSAADDSRVTVHYLYDLELGADHNLVGGEWYRNAHPGFLWNAVKDTYAVSVADRGLSADLGLLWDGRVPIPDAWIEVSPRASELDQPLAHVVQALLAISGQER